MRKKLLALLATLCMMFSLVGCSSEGASLIKEFQEVAKWEASEQAGTMAFDIVAGDQKFKLALDYTAYTAADKLQMEMTVTPKTLEVNGVALDLTQGKMKLSPVKVYMDGLKMYLSSSYLKEVLAIAGADEKEVAGVIDLSKDYIAIDVTDMYKEMGIDVNTYVKDTKKTVEDFYAELAKSNEKLSIKQDGRKYTIELSADEMVKAGMSLVVKSVEMQKGTLEKEYKAMGLSDEEIKAVMAEFEKLTSDEALAPVKEMIKGSTAKVVLTFEDGKETSEMDLNVNVAVGEDKVAIKFTMKDDAKKAAVKEVKMPTSAKVYTMNDLMALETATETVEADTTAKDAAEKAEQEKAEKEATAKDAQTATKDTATKQAA